MTLVGHGNSGPEHGKVLETHGWKTVAVQGIGFSTCVAVHWSDLTKAQLAWQIQPFHNFTSKVAFSRWFDDEGRHNNNGKQQVASASALWCPALFCHCWPSARRVAFKEARAKAMASSTNAEPPDCHKGDPRGLFSDMVTTPWLLVYLLRHCRRSKQNAAASPSYKLLQMLCTLATSSPLSVDTALGPIEMSEGRVLGQKCGDTTAERWVDELAPKVAAQVGAAYDKTSVAGWLWQWCTLASQFPENSCEETALQARDVTSDMLGCLSLGLQSWAWRQEEATPCTVIATHQRGAKRSWVLAPLLRNFLGGWKRTRTSLREWAEAGAPAGASGQHAEETKCARYAHSMRAAFRPAYVVELVPYVVELRPEARLAPRKKGFMA